ncbi:methionyl-tRNA formyltransferase-like protein [Thalassotalea sp. PS06]|uniref:methionyl-tRNA formyltransferase-like protein n=1 Tax=Thalassotalea sp. PS06 TaxID=2594005 RepID=UPI0011636B2A|nr:methionyl-tRNA formyltransferase-like protein [Thalassotalea sp. PS06]QDP01418.1 methionyl-tRNA formyltransferase-like protein [Thalassotalea sp. PS06]
MNIEQLLSDATSAIGENYFQLPIDGREDPIYRERVYCYELYHQLRLIWPANEEYELSGEIDKSGHPLIRGNDLDNVKPDLLVHVPGDMDGNHTIIEVKPITAAINGIAKDLSTLTAFRRHANYQKGIYLFYGYGNLNRIIEQIQELQFRDREDKIDINLIEVWVHERVGEPAVRVNLQGA